VLGQADRRAEQRETGTCHAASRTATLLLARTALANLRHEISDQTVGNILKAHAIEPAPERKRQATWKTFIQSHGDCLGAIDFTTIEVWTKGGLGTACFRQHA